MTNSQISSESILYDELKNKYYQIEVDHVRKSILARALPLDSNKDFKEHIGNLHRTNPEKFYTVDEIEDLGYSVNGVKNF